MCSDCIPKIKLIGTTIINVILLPLFLLFVYVPSYIYRGSICSLKLVLRQDLGPILSVISTLFASTNVENNPLLNVILNTKVNGKLNYKQIHDKITKHLIFVKNQHGKLIYPQFQMYPVQWMGYYFWKSVNNFDIENHISTITLQNGLNLDLEFEKTFGRETFKNGESPWKVLFVISEDDSYYHILAKFHHCLADGHSIFTSFMRCADNPIPPYIPKHTLAKDGNFFTRIGKLFVFPFFACYDYAKFTTTEGKSKSFLLNNMNEILLEPNPTLIVKSKLIKLSSIKEVSIKLGFPVNVIIMAAISGGTHHFLRRRGSNLSSPLTSLTPFPKPNRRLNELTNTYVSVIHPLPIEEMESLTRIQFCEHMIDKLKTSRQTKLPTILLKLFGTIPFVSLLGFYSNINIVLSTFPGPRDTVFLDGKPITEMSFLLYGAGITDFTLSMLTYDKNLVFTITGATHAFYDESDLQSLVEDIQDAFKAFEELCVTA